MNVFIHTSSSQTVTPAMRQALETQGDKLHKRFKETFEIHYRLKNLAKNQTIIIADTVWKGQKIQVREESKDFYAAADIVTKKLKNEIRERMKLKQNVHKPPIRDFVNPLGEEEQAMDMDDICAEETEE